MADCLYSIIPRSRALRGNAVSDAPRRFPALMPVTCEMDAERPRKGSHGDRGNKGVIFSHGDRGS